MRPLEMWLRYRRLALIDQLDRNEMQHQRLNQRLLIVGAKLHMLVARRRVVPFRRR